MFKKILFCSLILISHLDATIKLYIIHPGGNEYNYLENLLYPGVAFILQRAHGFDPSKPASVRNRLKEQLDISFYAPKELGKYVGETFKKTSDIVSWVDKALLENMVVSKDYLHALNTDRRTILNIVEMDRISLESESRVYVPLEKLLLSLDLYNHLVVPMKIATAGTVLAMYLATDERLPFKWAINLSGGYHHAKLDSGSGGCAISDIALAIKLYWKKYPKNPKVLIIDLDAHQGNGYATIFKNEIWDGEKIRDDARVVIYDIYNAQLEPKNTNEAKYMSDKDARNYIKYQHHAFDHINDTHYMNMVTNDLPGILDTEKPGLIIYNAGTDPFAEDMHGHMGLTHDGIIKRDQFVFKQARDRKIPIIMMPSGGYSHKNYLTISDSVKNIVTNVFGYKVEKQKEKPQSLRDRITSWFGFSS